MTNLVEQGWIGLALAARQAGHPGTEKSASYSAELDWIEEEIRLIRQNLLQRCYDLTDVGCRAAGICDRTRPEEVSRGPRR